MQGYDVQQNSASYPLVFLMISSTDHISGATGLSPTVTISKNGGAFASPSGAVTEIANGWYKVAGNATDTNTLGPILLHATATGADPTDACYPCVAYAPQDAVHLGLSALPNTACTTNASILTSGTGTDQLSVSAGKVLLQATQTGVTIPTVTNVGTLTTYTGNTPQTGDAYARIGANGAGLTALAPASTALSNANWTNARAGYLDNLNVGGAVASHADAASLSTQIGTPMQAGASVALDLTKTLSAARALDTVPDTSLTLNDVFHCAVAAAVGKQSVSGTAYTIETPYTGTVLRTFTLDSGTAPTQRS